MITASRPCSASASDSDVMLPTLLAIFSPPICSIPLCIQMRVSSAPRARRVCAASFSWCGKVRSLPPAWISKPAPPGGVPRGVLVGLAGFPQREVERVLLALGALDPLALVHVVDRAVAERT